MARKKGRKLNKRPKNKGIGGGKWRHGFIPRNAVARRLKSKTYRRKRKGSMKGRRR